MKKIIFVVFCISIFCNVVLAGSIEETRKSTVFPICINKAKTNYDKDLDAQLAKTINDILVNDYSLVKNDSYKEDFKKIAIDDISVAEKADVIGVFKDKADYVVIAEIEPILNEKTEGLLTKSVTSRGSIHIRIVDVNNNKYLLNESVSYKDRDSQLSVAYLSVIDIGKKTITMRNFKKLFNQVGDKIAKNIPQTVVKKVESTDIGTPLKAVD